MGSLAGTRIFLASLGNPAPYTHTLHSAGHSVISRIQQLISSPPFAKSRALASGSVSHSPEHGLTLWMSPTLMNVSGPAVAKAFAAWQRDAALSGDSSTNKLLVILHDELELPLGSVKRKQGSSSPRGHNGLKSVNGCIGKQSYSKIGIGIGRPESREPDDVARFVLRKMSKMEEEEIKRSAYEVVDIVEQIRQNGR